MVCHRFQSERERERCSSWLVRGLCQTQPLFVVPGSTPSCQHWPQCEHFARLLPGAGPAALPSPPPPTQEQQKAEQVELGIGQLSLGQRPLLFGQLEPEPETGAAPSRAGGSGAGLQMATPGFALREATASQQQQQQQQSMQTDDRPICCLSQRPEGCPNANTATATWQQQPAPHGSTTVFSCCHGRHIVPQVVAAAAGGGDGRAGEEDVAARLLAGGCSNGLRCPIHVGVGPLRAKLCPFYRTLL